MSAEKDLVLRHMGHGVRDQESTNCVVVGAVTPSASGVVELDAWDRDTNVLVVDVRLGERYLRSMNERVTKTYNEQCRGICAFESSAAALPFASQTMRSRLGSTRVSSSNGSRRRSNDCILRGKVWRLSVGMSACCILGRINVCIIDILMTDRVAVDRQRVDVEGRRKWLVQGPESSHCCCEKSFLVHLVGQARTGSATCSFIVLYRCQWFPCDHHYRQDLPLGRTLRRLDFAASKIHLQVPRGRQGVFLTSWR